MPLSVTKKQMSLINLIIEEYGVKVDRIKGYTKDKKVVYDDYKDLLNSGFIERWYDGKDCYLVLSKTGFMLWRSDGLKLIK